MMYPPGWQWATSARKWRCRSLSIARHERIEHPSSRQTNGRRPGAARASARTHLIHRPSAKRLITGEPLGLKPPHLVGRRRVTLDSLAADHPAHHVPAVSRTQTSDRHRLPRLDVTQMAAHDAAGFLVAALAQSLRQDQTIRAHHGRTIAAPRQTPHAISEERQTRLITFCPFPYERLTSSVGA
jgi:hypothetical protein